VAVLWIIAGLGCKVANSESPIGGLLDPQPKYRAAALERLEKCRSEDVVWLLREAKASLNAREISRESKAFVLLRALGVIRAAEAAEFLAQNIDVKLIGFGRKSGGEKVPLDSGFPALRSLIDIGSPAIDPLLEIVCTSDDPLRRHLAVVGLVGILGNRTDYAAPVLRRLQETHAEDESIVANLTASLEVMKRKDFLTSY
jgi:hypothetical protein